MILGLRVLGKRELGQLSLYDLVMVIILGNAVQNAMINNDNTLGGGLVAATVLLSLNWGLNRVISPLAHRGASARRQPDPDRPRRPAAARPDATTGHHDGPAHGGAPRTRPRRASPRCTWQCSKSDGTISVVPTGTPVLKTRRHYRGLRLVSLVLASAPVSASRVGEQAAKTFILVVVLLVAFRVTGKREIAQFTVYDLAMVMALSNAVQNAMTGGLGNFAIGLVTSSTLVLTAWVISRVIARQPRLEADVLGHPDAARQRRPRAEGPVPNGQSASPRGDRRGLPGARRRRTRRLSSRGARGRRVDQRRAPDRARAGPTLAPSSTPTRPSRTRSVTPVGARTSPSATFWHHDTGQPVSEHGCWAIRGRFFVKFTGSGAVNTRTAAARAGLA